MLKDTPDSRFCWEPVKDSSVAVLPTLDGQQPTPASPQISHPVCAASFLATSAKWPRWTESLFSAFLSSPFCNPLERTRSGMRMRKYFPQGRTMKSHCRDRGQKLYLELGGKQTCPRWILDALAPPIVVCYLCELCVANVGLLLPLNLPGVPV